MILDMHSDIINANYHQNSNKLFKASSILLTIMISMVKGFLIITIVSNTLMVDYDNPPNH